MKHRLLAGMAFILLLIALIAPAAAQSGPSIEFDAAGDADESPDVVDAGFPQLNLTLTPLSDSGVPIGGLTSADFTVTDGGEPVEGFVVNERVDPDQGVSVVLVLDVSGSMRDDIDALRAAAAALFDDVLTPADETAIITFAALEDGTGVDLSDPFPQITADREVAFTSDEGALKNLVITLNINEGDGTPLYDAIYKGARMAREDATNSRRVVIVMTDGVDENRQGEVDKGSVVYDRDGVIQELRELNVPVFTVGLGDGIDSAFLQRVANTTGGTYQNAPQATDLARIFSEVAAGLKIKYDLALESGTLSDGELHNLSIEASTPLGEMSATVPYKANYPIVPWVQDVQAANPRQDPRAIDTFESIKGTVTVQPRIVARNDIVGVDYYVNDELVQTVDASPWEFRWDTTDLTPGEVHNLRIEARDVADPPNTGVEAYSLLVEECNVLCQIEESTGIPPMYLFIILVGLLLLFALLMALRRRKPEPEPIYVAPVAPYVVPDFSPPPEPPATATLKPTVSTESPAYVAPGGGRPRARTEVLDRRQGPIAFLIDNETGRQFNIGDQTTIGSGAGNDIVLDDSAISGQHAKVKLEDGKLALFDLGSTNGTEVNGNTITRHVLADGDTVRLGRKKLTVKMV